jgi:hypothetical protein
MAHSPQGDRVDLLTPPYTAFLCMRTFQQKDIIADHATMSPVVGGGP